jgi:hypothetical protein
MRQPIGNTREILLKQKSLPRGNVFKPKGVNMLAGANRRRPKQEAQMTRLVIRCVTQGTFLTALIAVLSTTPAFAGVGGGVPAGLLRLDPPPSSYPGRSGIKATHKSKKTIRHSGIQPADQ